MGVSGRPFAIHTHTDTHSPSAHSLTHTHTHTHTHTQCWTHLSVCRVATPLSYFMSDQLYAPTDTLTNVRDIPLHVLTLPVDEQPLDQSGHQLSGQQLTGHQLSGQQLAGQQLSEAGDIHTLSVRDGAATTGERGVSSDEREGRKCVEDVWWYNNIIDRVSESTGSNIGLLFT